MKLYHGSNIGGIKVLEPRQLICSVREKQISAGVGEIYEEGSS